MAELKDSGSRRDFGTGAVRDVAEGKGRFDLVPLDVVGYWLRSEPYQYIEQFKLTNEVDFLYASLDSFIEEWKEMGEDTNIAKYRYLMGVAKVYEDGARKYDDNNWKKGIPVKVFLDSGPRHYDKWKQDITDEPHEYMFGWNIIGAIWTFKHHPELNEYRPITEQTGQDNKFKIESEDKL